MKEIQKFIRTDDGAYLNTDCIESFRDNDRPDGEANSVTIRTTGGQTHVLSTITADELAFAALRVLKEKLDSLTHADRTMPTSMRMRF